MKRTLGLFFHYWKWISRFSDKISLLVKTKTYLLYVEVEKAFHKLKKEKENLVVQSIDESLLFELEYDASNIAIATVLNEASRPVVFFARTLHASELKCSPIEKAACAVIESIRHWKQYLTGRSCGPITDKISVSFMLNLQNTSKIKNDKIFR